MLVLVIRTSASVRAFDLRVGDIADPDVTRPVVDDSLHGHVLPDSLPSKLTIPAEPADVFGTQGRNSARNLVSAHKRTGTSCLSNGVRLVTD